MRTMTAKLAILSFLGLLGILGGCNLQSSQGGTGSACSHPILGKDTPKLFCYKPDYWPMRIRWQAPSPPPETPWEIGKRVPGEIWTSPYGLGPALKFLRIPGFEERFLIGTLFSSPINEGCYKLPCRGSFIERLRDWDMTNPVYPYNVLPVVFGGATVSSHLPAITNRYGTGEAELEWVAQYLVPQDHSILTDPLDYGDRLERAPEPLTGKAFTFSQRYSFTFGSQGEILGYTLEEEARGLRYARELDPYPLSRGSGAYMMQDAQLYRVSPGMPRDLELEALAPRYQFHWTNLDYYTYRYASGNMTPPIPLCAPGFGWTVRSYGALPFLRANPYDYDAVPQEVWQREAQKDYPKIPRPYWDNTLHLVVLVERDVVDYWIWYSHPRNGYEYTRWHPVAPRDKAYLDRYPTAGKGNPPGTTLRAAILYRNATRKTGDWRPHPSHAYGEDHWHIVWSDVRLAGTVDRPDCAVERIGYHMYDLSTSMRLDSLFGLTDVPSPANDEMAVFYPTTPVLGNIGMIVDSTYTPEFLVPPGAVKLPDWALPPGW